METPSKAGRDVARLPLGGWRAWLCVAAAAVAMTLALFSPILNSDTFISSPDSGLRIPLVSHVKHVTKIFGEDFMIFTEGDYRPVSYAVIAVVRTLVAVEKVLFWRLWLLAFHVLNALLVYAVARRFTTRVEGALCAGALFLLHPVAAALGSRTDLFRYVLGGTLALGSLLCYVDYARKKRPWRYVLSAVLFLVGVFTTRALFALPVLLLSYDLLYERTRVTRVLARVVPFAAVLGLAVFCATAFSPHPLHYVHPPRPAASPAWFWTHTFAVGGIRQLVGLLSGSALAAPVGVISGEWTAGMVLFTGAVLLALAAGVVAFRKRQWFVVGLFLLVLGAGSGLNVEATLWQPGALVLAGFALLAGAALELLLSIPSRLWRIGLSCAAAGVIVLCGWTLCVTNLHTVTPVEYWSWVLEQQPGRTDARVHLGEAYLARDDEENARRWLFSPELTKLRPSCLAMARYYSRKGLPLAAIVHLRMAQREDDYGLQYQQTPMIEAEIMFSVKAYDFAEHWVGYVLMANRWNTDALKLLAEVMAVKGYVPAAVNLLEEVADIRPDDEDNAKRLAQLVDRLYNPKQDERTDRKKPPEPDWLRYATTGTRSRLMQKSVVHLPDNLPSDPVIRLFAGICLSEGGDDTRALREIDRAVTRLPAYAYAWASKCWAAANAEDIELAFKTLKDVKDLKPSDALTWHKVGTLMAERGKHNLAAECFRTAIKADANFPHGHHSLALLLFRHLEGHDAEAEDALRRAIALGIESAESAHTTLALILMRRRKHDAALAEAEKAVEVNPDYAPAYVAASRAHRRLGQWREAVASLSEGLKRVGPKEPMQLELIWLLSSAPAPEARDGKRAVRLAEKVARKTEVVTPDILDAQAVACAEAGDFKNAAAIADRAAALAATMPSSAPAQEIRYRADLYRRKIPWRLGQQVE